MIQWGRRLPAKRKESAGPPTNSSFYKPNQVGVNSINFVKAGATLPKTTLKAKNQPGLLSKANDWKITVDLNNQYEFPFHITETTLRPDIVIWSNNTKTILLIELTVPLEEKTAEAQKRKLGKYQDLITACKANGYNATTFTLEVGSRGWVAPSVMSCLRNFGYPRDQISKCKTLCSVTAMRLSYLIYINRNNKNWVPWEWTALMVPSYFQRDQVKN